MAALYAEPVPSRFDFLPFCFPQEKVDVKGLPEARKPIWQHWSRFFVLRPDVSWRFNTTDTVPVSHVIVAETASQKWDSNLSSRSVQSVATKYSTVHFA